MFYGDQINQTIQQSSGAIKQISDTFFNAHSLLTLVLSLTFAAVLGRIIASILRRFTKTLANRADKANNLDTVNKLRRSETLIVLSSAVVRTLLVIFALYFWWVYTHPTQKPGAIIGASALFALILGGVLSPLLRDIATGSVMMAEHWFGVSDHVTIEPFTLQGIVERVTLRSTKIRSLNGETIWINNQSISAVRITPKGVSTMALELFVSDLDKARELIDAVDLRLPTGPLMVVKPLTIMTEVKVGEQLWHITAIAETAPERQWLLEKYALQLLQELDEKNRNPVLLHEPIARFADSEAERRFARTITNATKSMKPRNQRLKKAAYKAAHKK
jgi:small conductance mechanosensitive channel